MVNEHVCLRCIERSVYYSHRWMRETSNVHRSISFIASFRPEWRYRHKSIKKYLNINSSMHCASKGPCYVHPSITMHFSISTHRHELLVSNRSVPFRLQQLNITYTAVMIGPVIDHQFHNSLFETINPVKEKRTRINKFRMNIVSKYNKLQY